MTQSVQQLRQSIIQFVSYTLLFVFVVFIVLCFLLVEKPASMGFNLSTAEHFLSLTWVQLFLIVSIAFYWGVRYLLGDFLRLQLHPWQNIEQWAEKQNIEDTSLLLRNNDPLSVAIRSILDKLNDAQQSDSTFEQLIRQRALLDQETGIGNREFFSNRLEALLTEKDSQGAVFLIQFNEMEINKIKHNDQILTLLEAAIQGISHRLEIVSVFFIARQNDYELALLIPNIFNNELKKIAENLLVTLKNIPLPKSVNKDEFVHIGLTACSANKTAYQVMAESDMALRTAELQGPSQWVLYGSNEVEQKGVKGSLKWRTLLQNTLEKRTLETFVQPVLDANSSQILHYEVFAKIKDESNQVIAARIFLPMAQKCGLSTQIDLAMLTKVWRQMDEKKHQLNQYSLNFSHDSLQSEQVINDIIKLLQTDKRKAQRLIIEISEYYVVNHKDKIIPALAKLHQYGVKILVDRVGQYVVNANYLKSGIISYAKLHKSIILDIAHKPENQVFIQSFKTLCDIKQVKLYALGVESFEEWQTLKKLGIDGGQGHYFTKPISNVS